MKKIFQHLPKLSNMKQAGLLSLAMTISIVIGVIVMKNQLISGAPTTLRLGYSFFGSIEEIDPNNIQTIYQSNIIENLFSRLIEYDNKGQIGCGLCSSFILDKATIHFFFGNPSKTNDGYLLDANSAKISLERILRSEKNTHGTLKSYLDSSEGDPIQIQNGQLIIKVAKAEWSHFVLNLLASMDFSIIPQESLDVNFEKIIDYKNTSGPYFVYSSEKGGKLLLSANKNHKYYNRKIPQLVQFVPIEPGGASEAFNKDTIDMIDPTYFSFKHDIEFILNHLDNYKLHKTLNIGLTNLVFSNRAMKTSTIDDRIAASLIIKDVFLNKTAPMFGSEITDQFFQSFGQGFIASDQHKILEDRVKKASKKSKFHFVLGVTEIYRKWLSQEDFPSFISLKFFKHSPSFLPDAEKPDIYIRSGDSSFDEDISALSYLFTTGTFSLNKDDGTKWIQHYMDLSSKADRIKLLQSLHYEMLYTVKVFPIISKPYIAICNSKWDFDFPKIFAGSPLWKIWAR